MCVYICFKLFSLAVSKNNTIRWSKCQIREWMWLEMIQWRCGFRKRDSHIQVLTLCILYALMEHKFPEIMGSKCTLNDQFLASTMATEMRHYINSNICNIHLPINEWMLQEKQKQQSMCQRIFSHHSFYVFVKIFWYCWLQMISSYCCHPFNLRHTLRRRLIVTSRIIGLCVSFERCVQSVGTTLK